MTLLIAIILIYGLKLSGWWYLVAGVVWLCSLAKRYYREFRQDSHYTQNDQNLRSLHAKCSKIESQLESLETNLSDLNPRNTFLRELPENLVTIEKKLDDQARKLKEMAEELQSQLENLEAEVQRLRD